MNHENTNNDTAEIAQIHTPGKLLKAAREARSRVQSDIAKKMHLSVQVIKDIENDDYTHVPALIYMRGYLRSYARLLEIPEETILQAFEAMDIAKEPEIHDHPLNKAALPIYKQLRSSKRRAVKWVSFFVSLLLVFMVVMWWQGQKSHVYSTAKPNTLLKASKQSIPIVKINSDQQTKQTHKKINNKERRVSFHKNSKRTLVPTYKVESV